MLPLVILVCVVAQLFAVDPGTRPSAPRQAGIVTGRIETEYAGVRAPLRRAKVILTREGARDSSTTSTDGEARYRFDGLTPGRYFVTVEKPGFVSIASALIDVTSTSRAVDLLLTPGGAVEGRLQDDRSTPIARVAVTADRLSQQGIVLTSYTAATDDLGRFRIHSLPAGSYRIRATPPPPASGEEHFYPGVITASDARVIAIAAGLVSDRLDFTVPVAPLSPIDAAAIEGAGRTAGNDAPDPKSTRVTGTVTRSDSGEPIVNATAQLTDERGVVRHRANTGLDGQFELAKVPAGTWTLSAVATGFASVDASVTRPTGAGIRVTVKDGDRIRQDIRLARISAIEGRVIDEFGDPAPGVVVQVAQKAPAVGLSRFLTSAAIGATGMTDDRGWFRAPGLFPGDYYLIAVPQPFEKSWMTGFAPTFFPGTTAADSATPISIVAGRDVYDARFAITGTRTGFVTGQVVDAAGRPVPGQVADGSGRSVPKSQVILLPIEDGEVRAMVMARIVPESDGTFTFRGVPDGAYVVQALAAGMFGVATVALDSAAREQPLTKLIAKTLTTARGRLRFEGDAPAPPQEPPSLVIAFQPTSFTTGPVGGNRIAVTIHPDWSFEIPNLAWFGVLRVSPPPGWALARIRHEGRDVTDTPVDFQSADVSGLEVVLTNRVGTVSGTVTSGGQPAAKVRVVVFGADDTSWTYLSRTMTNGRTDDRGTFTVDGLLPGRYLAIAISADVGLSDHASLLSLRSLGIPFTVSERTNTVVSLTVSR
jgi:protocatechuate 3,4-dioxygenase beta subunit